MSSNISNGLVHLSETVFAFCGEHTNLQSTLIFLCQLNKQMLIFLCSKLIKNNTIVS